MDLSVLKSRNARLVTSAALSSDDPASAPPSRCSEPGTNLLNPTIFHESWWLDAAVPGQWSEATVSAGGKLLGRFPYLISKRAFGLTTCEMPDFVHFLGPAVDEGSGAPCNRALKHAQIVRELYEQIPSVDNFYQRMHRGITDVMVFAEAGLHTLVNFTFEIAPAPEQRIWSEMRDKTRNIIRRAQERYTASDRISPAEFAAFYEANIEKAGHDSYYDAEGITRICTAAVDRGRGRILCARAADGSISAAIFCAWDATTCYYLLSTRDRGQDHGATALLIWEAIRHASGMGLIFDFDGLYTRGNRVFFTGFGGVTRPRYVVCRNTLPYRLVDRLGRTLGRFRR